MIVVFYSIQGLLLGILSYQDFKERRISLALLMLLTIITIVGAIALDFPINYYVVLGLLGFLILLKIVVFLSAKKSIIGNGDLILLLPLLMSLHLTEIPLFLILAGLCGVLTSKFSKNKAVPFVPVLSFAYGIVILTRISI